MVQRSAERKLRDSLHISKTIEVTDADELSYESILKKAQMQWHSLIQFSTQNTASLHSRPIAIAYALTCATRSCVDEIGTLDYHRNSFDHETRCMSQAYCVLAEACSKQKVC